MIAVQKVMTCFALIYPTASATAYGQRPKFFKAEHSATAEGENCAYGPTLDFNTAVPYYLDHYLDDYHILHYLSSAGIIF